MYLLGYDIGSSSIKASLIDANSKDVVGLVSHPEQEMDMIARQKGWAEQQPEIWWNNLCIATNKLLNETSVSPSDIVGIGISYQMHGLVLVDVNHQVLRPSIIWCDSRAVPIGEKAFQDLGEEFCLSNYLNSPGNFTASKLKWVKDNEPDIYNRIYKIMLPGDYINMKLTNQINTTISGLSEAVLWNFKEKKIASSLLDYYGLDDGLIPDVTDTFSVMGTVTQSAAEKTGLSQGIPVTYRAGDQPNNALSLNVLKPGEIAATCGTSGVVYGIMDEPIYDQYSRVNSFSHVNYENDFRNIGVLLCINGAGIEYSWIKHQIALNGWSYDDMERMASSVPVGAEGVTILPFGNGAERIFENKSIGSHILNLEFNRHTRAHMYRASLEAVAFSFVHGINIMKEMGLDLEVIRVSNDNLFQSRIFSTTIATLLGSQIQLVDTTGAVGAAKASGVKAKIYETIDEAMANTKPISVYKPEQNSDEYFQAYNQWQNELNKRLAGSTQKGQKNKSSAQDRIALKDELKEKNRIIASTSIKMDGYDRLLSDIHAELKKNQIEKSSGSTRKLLSRIKRLRSENLSKDTDVFTTHFDLLSDGFLKKIKIKHPQITMDELKVCALLKMNLSSKEIADKLHLSLRGVETKRYRIRKKIGLNKGENLVQYLLQVAE